MCNAGFYVPDVHAVEDLLDALASSSFTENPSQNDGTEHIYDIGEESDISLANLERLALD